MSVSAKEAFQLAFDANGGHERPVQWIKEDADNQRVFFQIYSKLFPIDLSANVRGVITGRTCARRHALHVRAQQICQRALLAGCIWLSRHVRRHQQAPGPRVPEQTGAVGDAAHTHFSRIPSLTSKRGS